MGKAGQELLQAQRAFFSWCLQAGRRRIKNFCMPSSTSSLRWLNTVERSVTTAGAAAGDQLDHFERGIEGVAGIDRLQKPARLFEESDRRFLDDSPAPGAVWTRVPTARTTAVRDRQGPVSQVPGEVLGRELAAETSFLQPVWPAAVLLHWCLSGERRCRSACLRQACR
jgi:hypothetical protein